MGFRPQNSLQSKFDHTSKISKSVSITNFPDDCFSKDIWKVCKDYGTVIDVFIPNRKSKAGKRFAFVRFIRVLNFDRLIENLKTIWIGSFHLFANPVRFERPKAHTIQNEKPVAPVKVPAFKQPNATYQGGPKGHVLASLLQPSLVLDDSCLVDRDLANCVMGEVRQFSSINNLQVILFNEGFHIARIVFLGGLWVMIELKSSKTKLKFMEHVGVASWFRHLCNAQSDFVAKERLVWVDIEGVPLNAWSRSTFQKIGSKWGEMVELEDGYDDLFARKRIFPEKELYSHNESVKINEEANNINNGEEENDSEIVSDTYFGDNGDDQVLEHHNGETSNVKEVSSDPFNIYGLIDKHTKDVRKTGTPTSIPYPPGFTPADGSTACFKKDNPVMESVRSPCRSTKTSSDELPFLKRSRPRIQG
ncbi:RNA-directed DNA polymerase, eukaryota [Tanacetum coccineum]